MAALRYARDFFEFAALFAVTRDAVAGHDALGVEEDARDLCRGTAIYTSDPGIFRTVIETRAPYLGPVAARRRGQRGHPRRAVARHAPHRAGLPDPCSATGPACVLYADNGEAPVSARRLGDLLLFISALGAAFERVIASGSGGRVAREQPRLGPSEPGRPLPAAEEPRPRRPTPPASRPRRRAPARRLPGQRRSRRPAHAPGKSSETGPVAHAGAVRWPTPRTSTSTCRSTMAPATVGLPQRGGRGRALVDTDPGSPRRAQSVARLAAQGDAAVQALVAALPGPLEDEQALEPTRLGPVPAALSLHGAAAVPLLLGVLQEADPARRRCAAVLLGAAAEPAAFALLADRALDADPRVAAAAADALARNRAPPGRCAACRIGSAARSSPAWLAARAAGAARALGALRDVEAIPLLIQVLETSSGAAAEAAPRRSRASRCSGSARTPGAGSPGGRRTAAAGRAEWLFSALTSRDRELRAAAAAELSEAAPVAGRSTPPTPAPAERASAPPGPGRAGGPAPAGCCEGPHRSPRRD